MPRMLTSEDTANIRNMLQAPPSMSPTQFAVSSLACVRTGSRPGSSGAWEGGRAAGTCVSCNTRNMLQDPDAGGDVLFWLYATVAYAVLRITTEVHIPLLRHRLHRLHLLQRHRLHLL